MTTTTSNPFEQTAPSANADGGNDTGTGAGVEVEASWWNWNNEGDSEAGFEGQDGDGAGPRCWHRSWNKTSKYAGAAALLVMVAAGAGIGVWQNKNKNIVDKYQASAITGARGKSSKGPQSYRVPKSKSSKAPSPEPSLLPSAVPSDSPSTSYSPSVTRGALLERWVGIGCSNSVECLVNNAAFPSTPSAVLILTSTLEVGSAGDNYGQRLQTRISPPVTCEWDLYISSDDHSELALSTDTNPSNKEKIASVSPWTDFKQWDKFSTQKGKKTLEAGKEYYLEAIHVQGNGLNHLAIGWECVEHSIPLQVIPAMHTRFPADLQR